MAQLALGTVQFGLDYGINNAAGKVSEEEVKTIITTLSKAGVQLIDTSAAYGSAETVVGDAINHVTNNFLIVSKYASDQRKEVKESLDYSLVNLKQNGLYGYLIHHFSDFQNSETLWDEMLALKAEGRIKKAGFSLYKPEELEFLFQKKIKFDIVQIPYNLFDRRFVPYFQRLKEMNAEIHIRSVFLQGLFLKKSSTLPDFFQSIHGKLELISGYAALAGIDVNSLALNYIMSDPFVDYVIIGIDNNKMLVDNIHTLNELPKVAEMRENLDDLQVDEERILLPYNWEKT